MTREHTSSGTKRFEAEHGSRHTLDRSVVLLNNIVEVLDLTNHDRGRLTTVDCIDCCLVGAAFIHRDLFRRAVLTHGFFEESSGGRHVTVRRQEEIDSLTLLVDSTVEILPDALDPNVRFVHSPARADLALVLARLLFDHWQKTDGPAIDC